MHSFHYRVPQSIWQALQARHQATGESISHIITAILSDQLQHEGDFRMSLPTNADFLKADLTRDPSQELEQAEKSHR
ncbi:MAG: hypothetical protein KME35_15640 [Aphanocapsa sp. GSE-SYN-MK-11-07L]|jgi:alpha-acetolactate decarboxylase|nr:hypothetical protein [Aphanocapsa sp. GSE-SYN-MK-11-07L]